MNIQDERKNQIYNFVSSTDVPKTRSEIGKALGFKSKVPSPYLQKLIADLVKEGTIKEIAIITSNNRHAWGYIKTT